MQYQSDTVNRPALGKFFMLFALAFFVVQGLQAQSFKFGPRFGVATSPINPQDISDWQDFAVSFQDGSAEYQVGAFARVGLLGVYIQPEFLFTTSSANYLVTDLLDGGTEIFRERYYNVEIPMMAGIKLGPVRAQAGPVYRLNLGNSSEFFSRSGFGRSFADSEVGIQAGMGLDIGKKLVLDLKYEFNMNDIGNDITIFGQTHQLSNRGSQFVGSIGYSF